MKNLSLRKKKTTALKNKRKTWIQKLIFKRKNNHCFFFFILSTWRNWIINVKLIPHSLPPGCGCPWNICTIPRSPAGVWTEARPRRGGSFCCGRALSSSPWPRFSHQTLQILTGEERRGRKWTKIRAGFTIEADWIDVFIVHYFDYL